MINRIENNELTIINESVTYTYNYPTRHGKIIPDRAFAFPASFDVVSNWAVMEDLANKSDHKELCVEMTFGSCESVPPLYTARFNYAKAQ